MPPLCAFHEMASYDTLCHYKRANIGNEAIVPDRESYVRNDHKSTLLYYKFYTTRGYHLPHINLGHSTCHSRGRR